MLKRKARIRPTDDAELHIRSSRDKPWFEERFIDVHKGRGVFATQPIEHGDFVLEYRGELVSLEECQSRQYTGTQSTFLFEFEWQKCNWCIDASREDGSLGRLVNDNHKSPNCIMKKIIVNNKPHLCIFAVKNIEAGSEIDYNYGDSKWPWRQKVKNYEAPAVTIETEDTPLNLTSHGESRREEAIAQVTNYEAPAVTIETEDTPLNLTSHEESRREEAIAQVTNYEAPAVTIETEDTPLNLTSHEESRREEAIAQVTNYEAPAVTIETEDTPLNLTSHQESRREEAIAQVTNYEAPAVTIETEDTPLNLTSHEESRREEAIAQVTNYEAPAVTIETEDTPLNLTSHQESRREEAIAQVTNYEAPAVTIETEDTPLNLTSHEESRRKEAIAQVFSVRSLPLVQYSDTDETDDFSDDLHESNESMVDETNDEQDHPTCAQVVPKMRRTKSILMLKLPDFSDALYDSSEDSAESPSSSESEMAIQRTKRSCFRRRLLTSRLRTWGRRKTLWEIPPWKRWMCQKMTVLHPSNNVPPQCLPKTAQKGHWKEKVNKLPSKEPGHPRKWQR
ncbi:uncharacterized protein LOC134129750 [Pungitius pungitius]|uniref:uncharacterized protein LOC134129750 n=1 Tax=Pungitius pungitius TaxID=134920 RepID=UPI002E144234